MTFNLCNSDNVEQPGLATFFVGSKIDLVLPSRSGISPWNVRDHLERARVFRRALIQKRKEGAWGKGGKGGRERRKVNSKDTRFLSSNSARKRPKIAFREKKKKKRENRVKGASAASAWMFEQGSGIGLFAAYRRASSNLLGPRCPRKTKNYFRGLFHATFPPRIWSVCP